MLETVHDPLPFFPDRSPWSGLPALRVDLERYLARRCRVPQDLEDAIQESFLRAARYRRGLRTPERLKPWLLRIARNALLDARRHERARRLQSDPDLDLGAVPCPQAPPEDLVEDPEEYLCFGRLVPRQRALVALRAALLRLTPRDRGLLLCHYGADRRRSTALSVRFGLTGEQAKVRLFRARRRLRSLLALELCAGELNARSRGPRA